ncbi:MULTISPECIES: DUF4097 family beta strand repeat-containing protein [Streptomycetaceae]|uniref:DUF4097 domain-containing protein n=1 Tax=Streptantibioticus cattleyicolor (strain ATCC 35852 / DSM 46488 / JCM 4925 / NBRC 14057 / NRRL 8057) TaxID=1003195 RepID=F8JPC3_STREN|nr:MULTISPECIES: DUF4097 family beta strand repeat-containing protein [Streptomycetaceae]AEW96476.1 hypothetical protein SCATT_41050 [Streptantibioticus cattleyicolor NRRL 8057 = DSM 46488]MYS60980.1 DUF4097 family beta strand repeat protein [Streptomyces sp. SID5468]CCB76810.1 conserved protein of unknown function [Streptantibioticus cattleyicolor NRRL 8057 = DSM 46488]
MSAHTWTVAEPRRITFDDTVTGLHVRVVGGTVNVVGTEEGPARLEVTELEGPPLVVTRDGGTLTVAYEDLSFKGLLGWLDRKGWQRRAVVSLTVPHRTHVEVGVVGATATVSGVTGRTKVHGVSGDTTLVGVGGPVDASTVSGSLEAQALAGDLAFNSVSGDLTVVGGTGSRLRADSVSGDIVLDLDPSAGADVRLNTVSGQIAVRIPEPGDAEVEASTASGPVSCAFDELRVTGSWGAKTIAGRVGRGDARLKATTVSGAIALLRRPPAEPADAPRLTKDL